MLSGNQGSFPDAQLQAAKRADKGAGWGGWWQDRGLWVLPPRLYFLLSKFSRLIIL